MKNYISECDELCKSSKGALELLKDERLSKLATAMKMHLDDSAKEAFID